MQQRGVTVNTPPAVVVPTNTMSAEEEFKANVQDVFFDYEHLRHPATMPRPPFRAMPLIWRAIRM